MSTKRKLVDTALRQERTPKQKPRLVVNRKSNEESPRIEKGFETSPSICSTPKSQYSDDSLSQDYSPGIDIDVGWKSKKKVDKKFRVRQPRIAKTLAKEQFERSKSELVQKPLPSRPEPRPGEISALDKFKLGIKKLEMVKTESLSQSPKSSKPSSSLGTQSVSRSFKFGDSDDSDEERSIEPSWNILLKKFDDLKENHQLPTTPTKHNDDNWRKTKSAQELNTSTSTNRPISEPLKDLFDDSISDSLLCQCTQQIERKLANIKNPVKSNETDNPLDNDSFDELLSSFPLEELVQKSSGETNSSKKQSTSFSRHNSLPCQSKITSIVQKVNLLVEQSNNNSLDGQSSNIDIKK